MKMTSTRKNYSPHGPDQGIPSGMPRYILFALLIAFSVTFTVPELQAACIDNDGDGYGSPASGDCTYAAEDCNDGDPAISPGAVDICGDGIDNNCDGISYDPGADCIATAAGVCPTASKYAGACPDLTCPEPISGYNQPETEAWTTPASCTDGRDNDCDGLTDMLDPGDTLDPNTGCGSYAEICDGYDNNWDAQVDEGFTHIDDTGEVRQLGDPCSIGLGICQRSGTVICSSDGLSATCTASAGKAKSESIDDINSCSDLKDNDCDGTTDLADTDCLPPPTSEICDGIDNDLDSGIDEDFDVGAPCSIGVGACENFGTKVCTADGMGTKCNVFALAATIEGPTGPTCSDTVDNDCDGLTDTQDASCDAAAAALEVHCALPFTNGQPGDDCVGVHKVYYGITGGGATTQIHAEFLGLSPTGEILAVLPGVRPGDEAMLASRLDPSDFKMVSKTNTRRTKHEVFAPVPLLHVTARDGDAFAEAYCSNIAYLDVIRPEGTVAGVSSGDVTEVTTALPLVDPTSLTVLIDCVDVLAELGIDPASDFPGGPFSGTVMVDGKTVEIQELVVDVADDINEHSANTLTMIVKNIGGGGHVIYVNGEPVSQRANLTEECLQDDIADSGDVSMLEVTITSPTDQEIIDPIPPEGIAVTGLVHHGRMISSLELSGKDVAVSGQTFTNGDGICSADQYKLPFDELLAETDLDLAVAGNALPGTIQRGANNIVADASDDLGNRAFASRMFGAGNVLSPAQSALIAQRVEATLSKDLAMLYNGIKTATETKIENAFVAGLEADAVKKVFKKLLADAVEEFKARAVATWQGRALGDITIEPDCSCNVTATLRVTGISFGSESDSDVVFSDGQLAVTFQLPDVTVSMAASNSCETTFLGACVAETVLNITAKTIMKDPDFTFTITEEGIETSTPPSDDMKSFVLGELRYPGSNDESLEDNSEVWTSSSDINCLGAGICSFFEGIAGFTIEIVTLGFVEAGDVFDFISVDWQLADFEDLAGSADPEPVGIGDIAIDNQVVEDFGKAAFAPTLNDVTITSDGLTAAFGAVFTTLEEDPNIDETPGAAVTPAPAPGAAQGTAQQNGYIVLADDTINQLFASMAKSGGLQTQCQNTGKTVNDLLPTDCESLTGKTEEATATLQGICYGIRAIDCETLTAATPTLQGVKQGACHGIQGDECSTIPVTLGSILVERAACNLIPDVNLAATDPLMFCAKQSIPPQMLINDDTSNAPPDSLDTTLLLNDMSVSMVVDRGNAGLEGALGGTPNCFAADASTLADCNLFVACIDITLGTKMSLDNSECNTDETGFIFSVDTITTSGLEAGVVCGAATQTDDAQITDQAAADSTVDEISKNVEIFTPPLCAKGLNLGNLLNFQNPKLISIDTGGPDDYADYFGIIGEINP